MDIIRVDSHRNETLVGYLRNRCVGLAHDRSETCTGTGALRPHCLFFDSPAGRLLVKSRNTAGAVSGTQVFAIRGFASLFDVAQTFSPVETYVGFRVPYMPEGLPAADRFDTYYGTLSTVGDWSQAQPLQCGYPSQLSAGVNSEVFPPTS